MKITAKFASVCPLCDARIAVGESVEWTRDTKARHVACAGTLYAPAAVRAQVAQRQRNARPTGLGRRTGCSCGSREGGSQDSDCWTCRHDAE